MHDEWIGLSGEKLAADGIGEAECASGYGADPHQLPPYAENTRTMPCRSLRCAIVSQIHVFYWDGG